MHYPADMEADAARIARSLRAIADRLDAREASKTVRFPLRAGAGVRGSFESAIHEFFLMRGIDYTLTTTRKGWLDSDYVLSATLRSVSDRDHWDVFVRWLRTLND